MKNGKPIFEEERLLLKLFTGIDIPTDCWRHGTKIYLDSTCDKPIYNIKLEESKSKVLTKEYSPMKTITNDIELKKLMNKKSDIEFKLYRTIKLEKKNEKLFESYTQKSIVDLIEENKERLLELEKNTIDRLEKYFKENLSNIEQIIISHSSGKDSTLTSEIFFKTLERLKITDTETYEKINSMWLTNFANTTNATSIEYRIAKSLPRVKILNPKKGLLPWLREEKKYHPPTILRRNCCSQYKEGQLTKNYDKNKNILMLTGVRCYESKRRADYTFCMDHEERVRIHGVDTLPNKWTNLAIIFDWTDIDVWLYMLMKNIEFNPLYKLGFHRIGCLNCPMQQDYIDILTEYYYENSKKRWDEFLEQDYKRNNQWRNLKWTKEEYIDYGKWKTGTGFEHYITNLKLTEERAKMLAERKGCEVEIAKRFWDKKCSKCGEKLTPPEISMSEKLHRNKEHLCKNCLCEGYGLSKEQYKQLKIDLYNSDCTLF